MMRIVFPEYENEVVKEGIRLAKEKLDFEAVKAVSFDDALDRLKCDEVDAMVAGIDLTTRDVILGCRDTLGVKGKTFSSCFYFEKAGEIPFILADAGVTKEADVERLFDIVMQTYETALKLLDEEPRIAMLSFSTKGSARDASIDKINEVIAKVHEMYSEVKIDGEMQLDAAVNSRVAAKKLPDSEVAGRANVLIVPDLNSGNILYKAIEQFGGYIAAGPILQGFHKPVSDLSRGSTMEDVKLVIECMGRLLR